MYIKHVFFTVRKESPVLFWITVVHLLECIGALVLSLVDHRSLMGVNLWIKPMKFSISTAIYLLTVGFLMTKYPYSKRKKTFLSGIVSWTLLVEIALIFLQASRGVQSHYNKSSLLDGLIFAAMGILIAINVLVMLLFIYDTIRLKLNTTKEIQWAILLGWIILFLGSLVGGKMIKEMAHTVGAQDGGPGLPFLNWSTLGGDLRVAHFLCLHGIQILPIFAFFIATKTPTSNRNKILLVTLFAFAYTLWIGHTYYAALQGYPFIKM